MKNHIIATLLLAGIVSACAPGVSVVSSGGSAADSPAVTGQATLPAPETSATPLPAKPTATATPDSTAFAFSTPVASDAEEIPLPVFSPSLRIGKGSATSLAVSPDGKWMAVGTQFGVYQYHADTFEQARFTPLEEYARQMVFDPQSKRLGVSTGGAIVLFNSASGAPLARLENAGSWFGWSADGQRLVSGGGCEQVTVWDANSGAMLKALRGGKCSEGYSGISVTWGADGRIYGASMGTNILTWDGVTYQPIETFSAQGAGDTWISTLFAAPSGSLIAQYDRMGRPVVAIIDGQQDRQVQLLDQQVNGGITALAWAPDGKRLAVAYGIDTGLILVWNAQTGQVEEKIKGFYSAVDLDWSTDGQILFGLQGLDRQISAVEVHSRRVLRSFGGHTPAGSFLTWTGDGLVSTDGLNLTWWDPASGRPLRQEPAGSPQAWVVFWPPDGPSTFLFTQPQGAHLVGSSASRHPLASDENQYPFPTAWSWDDTRLADPTRVWDVQTGDILARLQDPAQQHTPDQVAWSPDGASLSRFAQHAAPGDLECTHRKCCAILTGRHRRADTHLAQPGMVAGWQAVGRSRRADAPR